MSATSLTNTALSPFEVTSAQPSLSVQVPAVEMVLQKGEVRSFELTDSALTIRVFEGALWVTCEGDGRDIILSEGQAYRAEGPGLLVLECLSAEAHLATEEVEGLRG